MNYPTVNYFNHAPLNRCADKRKDTAWLNEQMKNPKSKYVLFSKLQPLAAKLPGEKRFRLAVLNYEKISDILGEDIKSINTVVFLGIEESLSDSELDGEHDLTNDDCVWFAIDVGSIDNAPNKFLEACPDTEYLAPRPGFLQVHMEDATILAQARPILEWHQFNKFCPRCGSEVSMQDGGYKQSCSNTECASNKSMCICKNQVYKSVLDIIWAFCSNLFPLTSVNTPYYILYYLTNSRSMGGFFL